MINETYTVLKDDLKRRNKYTIKKNYMSQSNTFNIGLKLMIIFLLKIN